VKDDPALEALLALLLKVDTRLSKEFEILKKGGLCGGTR